MAKKLSIIRFKPKPEYYDTFLNDVVENGKDRDPEYPHFCVKARISYKIASKFNINLVFYGENEAEYGNPIAENSTSLRNKSYF